MMNDRKELLRFCDQHIWQSSISSSRETERINATLGLLPSDFNSIIDVGCGDGRLLNRISKDKKTVVGIDYSYIALQNLKYPKVQGLIEDLPFKTDSFDMVISTEVIEHLSDDILQKYLSEMERICRKYLLITVPWAQNLDALKIKCPHCAKMLYQWGHIRTIKSVDDIKLSKNFKLLQNKKIFLNPRKGRKLRLLYYVLEKFGQSCMLNMAQGDVCHYCGKTGKTVRSSSNKTQNRFGICMRMLIKLINYLFPKKGYEWVGLLFEKTDYSS